MSRMIGLVRKRGSGGRLSCILAAILSAMSPSSLYAQKIAAQRGEQARLTVPVYIDGKGPFDFMLDTAATTSAVSTELAGKLALPSAGSTMLQDAHGRNRVAMARVAELRVGANAVANLALPVFARADVGADGILGADAFRDRQVVIDMKRRDVVISDTGSTHGDRRGLKSDQVWADPRRAQMFVTNADINGFPITIVIDSGATLSLINASARRILGPGARQLAGVHASLVSVSGTAMPLTLVNLPEVRIGNFLFTDAAVVVADLRLFAQLGLEQKPAMLMGMDGLSKFERITLDFRHKRVTFSAVPSSLDMQLRTQFAMGDREPMRSTPMSGIVPSQSAPAAPAPAPVAH